MIKIEVLTDKRTCKACKHCSLNVVTKGYTCELLNRTITKHYKNKAKRNSVWLVFVCKWFLCLPKVTSFEA